MLHVILACVIAAVGIFGLLGNTGLLTGKYFPGTFAYYTNLSNLLVVLYHLLWLSGLGRSFLNSAAVQLSVTCCITVTFLIYHFLLRRLWKQPTGARTGVGLRQVCNVCVHYAVPLLTLLEWLLTADHANVSLSCALWWLLLPLAYCVFALLRARTGRPIPGTASRYPYPFMDLDLLGPKKLLRNILTLLAAFFLLACLFVLLSLALR